MLVKVFVIYSILFECCCASVSDYGSEIWGFEPKQGVSKIHLRAARSYLGVPKNTTSVGVLAEINWMEPVYRAQIRMIRQYFRVKLMDNSRITKKIFNWDKNFSMQFPNIQTWYSEVREIFDTHNMLASFGTDSSIQAFFIENLKQSMLVKQTFDLKTKCTSKPKLRTFNTFMDFGATPSYLLIPLSFVQKMFLAKTRLAALPIRLETGRYERPRLLEQERLCPSCKNGESVENEEHFIFFCEKYHFLRQEWLTRVKKPVNFCDLNLSEKFKIIFNESDNVKITAQYIVNCYDVRSKILFPNL